MKQSAFMPNKGKNQKKISNAGNEQKLVQNCSKKQSKKSQDQQPYMKGNESIFLSQSYLYNFMNKYQGSTEAQRLDIDSYLSRLLDTNSPKITFTEQEIKDLINACKYILLQQPMALELQAPVKVVGNIHGQYSDLLNIFKMSGAPGDTSYLFLGNYIDRGGMSLECIMLLLAYKFNFPDNFFLLRGNHEVAGVNRFFGFYEECKRKTTIKVWKMFNELFNMLPLCAVIERKIFCVHGGLSPQMQSLQQINKISRPLQITNQSLPIDLLWADPEPFITGWQQNQRGISYVFGMDSVITFLRQNHYDLIVRSHQVIEMGYEFLFNKTLLTIFSVPNYLGQYENYGAVLVVQEDLKCSFELVKPKKAKKGKSPQKSIPVKK